MATVSIPRSARSNRGLSVERDLAGRQCVVRSVGLNAWAIRRGLALLQMSLSVESDESGLLVAGDSDLSAPTHASGQRPVSETQRDLLFCTDERTLSEGWAAERFEVLPSSLPVPLDDKLCFSEMLERIGERPVPFSTLDNQAGVVSGRFPVLLKARHSWYNGLKMPRGYVCRSAEQLQDTLAACELQGWPRSTFFLQQLVNGIRNNYSACGFFDACDPGRNAMILVRRVMDTAGRLGTGAVVETVHTQPELLERTARILEALDYRGPFELEFLRDDQTGEDYVLELNPRFWMQHGLFVDAYGNQVLKLYLNGTRDADWEQLAGQPAIWISGLELLRWCVRFRLGRLAVCGRELLKSLVQGRRVCIQPGLVESFHVLRRSRQRSASRSR